MARAMDERVAEAGFLDNFTRGAIGVLAADGLALADPALNQFDRRVTRARNDCERPRVFVGHALADETHPGEVAIDAVRRRFLGE